MSEFRTVYKSQRAPFDISHADRLMSIGSCFSEGIGKKLFASKLKIDINPFGQQYNPLSIAKAIQRLIDPVPYEAGDLHFRDGLYHSFDHHGDFSFPGIDETLDNINTRLQRASETLRTCDVLFLTFGTSHVYRRSDSGDVVSNCHKFPSGDFVLEKLPPDAIAGSCREVLQAVKHVNPKVQVVFTISPVRYLAFGMYENSVSKAHLFTAVNELLSDGHYYFPAYELVMDDLRDYRFYADDMLHPNPLAIDYVWERMKEMYMNEETLSLLGRIDEIQSAANHRPRNAGSEAHRKFVMKYLQLAERVERE
ncbi:MAG: GSCFA domain-containing protein, partial [Flavobacteriales bacterium]|nr:GSCFA domain-containing protein [Flavobacteriales bacterium]